MQLADLPALIRRDPRLSRAAALLVAALMLLLLWLGLVQPVIDLLQGDHAILNQSRLLGEQRRLAERQPALLAEKQALVAAGPDLGDFLPGASPALAAADLQSRLGVLVSGLGGTVQSIEPLPLPDEQGFRRAGLRVKLTLRQDALAALLHGLEYGHPRLFVPTLQLKGGPDELAIAIDLFGYLPWEAK